MKTIDMLSLSGAFLALSGAALLLYSGSPVSTVVSGSAIVLGLSMDAAAVVYLAVQG